MYDFVSEFPMLYIEPVTRKEIEECSAMEKKLQGGQSQQPNLEEVQRCKARALSCEGYCSSSCVLLSY